MIKSDVVFIGAGNMAEALVKGLVQGGVCPAKQITVTDPRAERLDFFRTAFAVNAMVSNTDAVAKAGIVVLAVKPQSMSDVLLELKGKLPADAVVVSIAAGTLTKTIEAGLGGKARVVRVMPNTPALVGAGASAVCPGQFAKPDDVELTSRLMESVGLVVRVDEGMMDAVTALSGSGPAYVFYVMESMIAAAKKLGMDETIAKLLTYATISGAAKLATESGAEPAELRHRVTSKGGTTAAAIDVMQQKQVGESFIAAIEAAARRSRELSKG
jgi:pyrroline-5-carboxylate reductase